MVKVPPILNSVDYTEFTTYTYTLRSYPKQLALVLRLLIFNLYVIGSLNLKLGEQRTLTSKVSAQQKQALLPLQTMA